MSGGERGVATKENERVDKRNQEWIGVEPRKEAKRSESQRKGECEEGAGKEQGKNGATAANQRQGGQIGGRTNIHAETTKIIYVAPLRFAMFGSAAETDQCPITRYRKMTAGVS